MAMGIPDIKSIDREKPISSLGLDSIGGTEIQQAFEREFRITLSFQELKSKTLNELEALIGLKTTNIKAQSMTSLENIHVGMLTEEIKFADGKPKMLLFPRMIGGLGPMWRDPIIQFTFYSIWSLKSFDELFDSIIDDVIELYKNEDEFILVGYSFGSVTALRICERFESMGKPGKLIFIDGSPSLMKVNLVELNPHKQPTDEDIQNRIFNELTVKTYGGMADTVLRNDGTQTEWKHKFNEFTKAITDEQSKEFLRKNLESSENRLRMVMDKKFDFNISENYFN
jgi:acyl carrier protein